MLSRGSLLRGAAPRHLARRKEVLHAVRTIQTLSCSRVRSAKGAIRVGQKRAIVATSTSNSTVLDWIEQTAWRIIDQIWQFIKALRRCTTYGIVFSPVAVLAPILYFLDGDDAVSSSPDLEKFLMDYLLWALQSLGPTFVKLGQWASTRADIFPDRVLKRLVALQTDVKTHSWSESAKLLEAEYGEGWEDWLELEREPIGSGCIAQVYRGTLKKILAAGADGATDAAGGGLEVAVKLLHPSVRQQVDEDLYIMGFVARVVELLPALKYLSIHDAVEEFGEMMTQQMDLRNEGRNLRRFADNFDGYERRGGTISFPKPVRGLEREGVLVEQFMAGTPMDEYLENVSKFHRTDACVQRKASVSTDAEAQKMEEEERSKKRVNDLGVNAVLKMIFRDGFIHSDLHPGNILVNEGNNGELGITFLDAGIVNEVDRTDRKLMVDIALAMLKLDGRQAAEHIVNSTPDELSPDSFEGFVSEVEDIVRQATDEEYSLAMSEYVLKLCSATCHYRVKVEAKFLACLVGMKVMEGIGLQLDPYMSFVTMATPTVVSAEAEWRVKNAVGLI